jgi:hypothetical protein
MRRFEMSNIPLKLFVFVLSVIKALWNAVVAIVWGLASFFLLAGLLVYFKQDTEAIQSILALVPIITKYWLVFFSAIFIYEVLYSYKELIPKDKVVIKTEREPMNEEPLEQIEYVMEKEKKRAYMREYMKKYKAKKKTEEPKETEETAVAAVTDVIESEDEAREKRNAYMRAYQAKRREERKKKEEEEKVEEIKSNGS